METIEIKGLEMWARHGVMEHEREVGNKFKVDVTLTADLSKAMETDSIEDTVNYARVAEIIEREMSIPSRLLENVLWRIKRSIISAFPSITGGYVAVTKIVPPIPCVLESVSVATQW